MERLTTTQHHRKGTVNLSSPRAIFAGSPARFTRSRVTYEAYAVSRTPTRPQVDSAPAISNAGVPLAEPPVDGGDSPAWSRKRDPPDVRGQAARRMVIWR